MDDVLLQIVTELCDSLAEAEAETAHLKTIGLWEGFFGVANLISSENQPELSLPSNCNVKEADVIVNARVACDPVILSSTLNKRWRQFANSTERKPNSAKPKASAPTPRADASLRYGGLIHSASMCLISTIDSPRRHGGHGVKKTEARITKS